MKGSGRRAPIATAIGALMAFDAVTFLIAASLHLNARIPLGFAEITGKWVPRAAIPEAIIGLVLALGASIVLLAPVRAWAVAVASHAFALVGVGTGLFTIAVGVGPRTVPDIAYHLGVLAPLGAGLALLFTGKARAALHQPSLQRAPG